MGLISKLTKWFKGSPISASPMDSARKWYKGEPYTTLGPPTTTTGLGLPAKLSTTLTLRNPTITAVFNDQQRVSQIYAEFLYELEPRLETSQVYVEFLYTVVSAQPVKQSLNFTLYEATATAEAAGGIIHTSAASVDILYTKEPQVQVESTAIDVLYTNESQVSVSAASIDILYATNIHAIVSLPALTLNHTVYEPYIAFTEWDVNDLYFNEIYRLEFSASALCGVPLQHILCEPLQPTAKCSCRTIIDLCQPLLLNSYDASASITFSLRHLVFSTLDPEIHFANTVQASKLPLAFEFTGPEAIFDFVVEVDRTPTLILDPHDVDIRVGGKIDETLSLTFTPYYQTAFLQASPSPLPSSLIFQLHEPTPRVHIAPVGDILHLQFEQNVSSASIGSLIKTVGHLYFNKYNPTLHFSYTQIIDEVLPLRFNLHPASGLVFSAIAFSEEPLHVEGEYCALFDMLNEKAYFNRPNADLSPGFPGKYSRIFTLTCWVRLVSYYGWQSLVCVNDDTWQASSWALEFHSYITGTGGFLSIDYNHADYPYWGSGTVATDIELNLNTWYHIALMIDGEGTGTPTVYGLEPYSPAIYMRVWDHKNKRIQGVYRNSREKQSDLYTATKIVLGTADFQIGCTQNQTDFFDGYMDEVVLFNAIRSPLETDTIRKFQYNGQIAGDMVEEFGEQVGYRTADGVAVSEFGGQVGYHPYDGVVITEFGLQVGYRIEHEVKISPDPVITGMSPSFETEITYKFESDVFKREEHVYLGDGVFTAAEERKPKIGFPLISAKATLNINGESAFLRMAEVVRSGAAFFSMPLWCFKQNIIEDVKKGDREYTIGDLTEFRDGEKSLLVRANDFLVYELCQNAGTDGFTKVIVESSVRNHYNTFTMPTATVPFDSRSSYAIPCITGILNVESIDFSRGPTFSSKVHVDGGVWLKAPMPSSPIESFTLMPQLGRLLAPQISRDVLATDHGRLTLMNHMKTSAVAFELEWNFHNTDWRLLRDLFFSAMGRYGTFFIPMWLWEVKVKSPATFNNLSQNLELQVTWPHNTGDDNMWKRFRKIYFQSHLDATKSYIVTLNDYNPSTPAIFSVSSVTPSPFTITAGDRGTLGVNARFMEDSLTFEFLGPNLCHVKATFTEAL